MKRQRSGEFDRHGRGGATLALDRQRASMKLRQAFGNNKAEPQSLLLMHFSVELHVSSHSSDVFGRKTAAFVHY